MHEKYKILFLVILLILSIPLHKKIITTDKTSSVEMISYDHANQEQKIFLEKLEKQNPLYSKEDSLLFYFDKDIVIVGVGSKNAENTKEWKNDHFLIGLFDRTLAGSMQKGGLETVACKNATTFKSTCSYVLNNGIVFLNPSQIFYYKAGRKIEYLEQEVVLQTLNGGESYVKDYDDVTHGPVYDTKIENNTLTVGIYKDNESIGMGNFDTTKKNEKLRVETFDLK